MELIDFIEVPYKGGVLRVSFPAVEAGKAVKSLLGQKIPVPKTGFDINSLLDQVEVLDRGDWQKKYHHVVGSLVEALLFIDNL